MKLPVQTYQNFLPNTSTFSISLTQEPGNIPEFTSYTDVTSFNLTVA